MKPLHILSVLVCLVALSACKRAKPVKPGETSGEKTSAAVQQSVTTAGEEGRQATDSIAEDQAKGEAQPAPQKKYAPVVGKRGGSMVISTISDPKSFNPVTAGETSTTEAVGPIFEGLTTADPDTLMPEPNLAESWETSEDGLTWTFHLRKDVRWNDGEPFTADDVLFTFNDLYLNPEIPNSTGEILTVKGKKPKVAKIDDYTVKIELAYRYAPFLRAMGAEILPKHRLKEAVKTGRFEHTWTVETPPNELVGTGPFMLTGYEPAQRLVYERNPHYWKRDAEGSKLPYLDQLVTLIVKDINVAMMKFRSGETDVYGLRPEDYQILRKLQEEERFTIYRLGPGMGSRFLFFNQNTGINPETKEPFVKEHKQKWFRDVRFRQAIAHSLDRETMIDNVLYGLGYPQYGPKTISEGYFFNPNVHKYDYDLDKARRLLAEMGLKDRDGDGVLQDANGNVVEFTMLTNAENNIRDSIANIIKTDLETVGMKVNYRPVPFNQVVAKLDATYDW